MVHINKQLSIKQWLSQVLRHFYTLEQRVLEGVFAAYPVLRYPLQHLVYKVGALFYVFLRVVLVGQDLTEVAARRVVELVH